MTKLILLTLSCLLTLCSCNSQPTINEEITSDTLNLAEPTETVVNEPVTTPITTDISSEPSESTAPITSETPAISQDESSDTSTKAPEILPPVSSETTSSPTPPPVVSQTTELTTPTGPVELTPLESEGKPLLIGISPTSVSRIVYNYSQNTTEQDYKSEFVTLKNSSLKKEMLSYLNGLVYVPLESGQREEEALEYEKWKQARPSAVLIPESITLYDYTGKEIIRFYSDAVWAVPRAATPTPYIRALYNGVEYELFYGEMKYDKLQFSVTNAVLLQSGSFTLQTYSSVAKKAIAPYSSELSSQTASSYRLYPPDSPIISTDGTVLYPSDFPSGTLLVDCIYSFTEGGNLIVTLDAKDAEILRIEATY